MTTLTTQVQINAHPDIVWKMLRTFYAVQDRTQQSQSAYPHRGRWGKRHGHACDRGRLQSQLQDIIWKPGEGFEGNLVGGGPISSGTLQVSLAPERDRTNQTVVTQTLNYEPKSHPLVWWWRRSLQSRIQRHLDHHLQHLKTAAEIFSGAAS